MSPSLNYHLLSGSTDSTARLWQFGLFHPQAAKLLNEQKTDSRKRETQSAQSQQSQQSQARSEDTTAHTTGAVEIIQPAVQPQVLPPLATSMAPLVDAGKNEAASPARSTNSEDWVQIPGQ